MWSRAPLLGAAQRIPGQEGRRFSHIYTTEACKHLLRDVRKRAEASPPALILRFSFSFWLQQIRSGCWTLMDPLPLPLNASLVRDCLVFPSFLLFFLLS